MEQNILLSVLRYPSEKDWTLSEFFIQGVKYGVGVEDEHREKKKRGETRIPNGIYEFGFTNSPSFSGSYFVDSNGNLSRLKNERFNSPHLLLTLFNVPNFERILWHWGNTDDNTMGCYLVGANFATFGNQSGVTNSRITYTKIYPVIYNLWRAQHLAGQKTFVEYKDRILV